MEKKAFLPRESFYCPPLKRILFYSLTHDKQKKSTPYRTAPLLIGHTSSATTNKK
jgi:hypothetical protein